MSPLFLVLDALYRSLALLMNQRGQLLLPREGHDLHQCGVACMKGAAPRIALCLRAGPPRFAATPSFRRGTCPCSACGGEGESKDDESRQHGTKSVPTPPSPSPPPPPCPLPTPRSIPIRVPCNKLRTRERVEPLFGARAPRRRRLWADLRSQTRSAAQPSPARSRATSDGFCATRAGTVTAAVVIRA